MDYSNTYWFARSPFGGHDVFLRVEDPKVTLALCETWNATIVNFGNIQETVISTEVDRNDFKEDWVVQITKEEFKKALIKGTLIG